MSTLNLSVRNCPFIGVSMLILFGATGQAQAESLPVEKCNGALVQSTYMLKEGRFRDWRLAERVSQSNYEEVKKSAGLSAQIYGVPLGASWSDFQKNISESRQEKQESLTESEFRNIAWTGLNDGNVAAYTACVNALVTSTKGISLALLRSTETEITAQLYYNPKGSQSTKVPILWTGSGAKLALDALPGEAINGVRDIIFNRPKETSAMIGVFSPEVGDSSSVVLLPLPPVDHSQPVKELPSICEFKETPGDVSVPSAGTKSWLCPPLKAGKYHVSFSVKASTPQGMTRVGYSITAEPTNGEPVTLKSGGTADLSVPPKPGLFPSVFAADQTIELPGGSVRLILSINNVFSHLDFKNGNFGSVQLSKNVDIHLQRLE
jgi:hypothetical protein